MSITRDVEYMERELQRVLAENDQLRTINEMQKNEIVTLKDERALLRSERDRYMRTNAELGQLLEGLSSSLVTGIQKFRNNEEQRNVTETHRPAFTRAVVRAEPDQGRITLAEENGQPAPTPGTPLPRVNMDTGTGLYKPMVLGDAKAVR